MPDLKIPGRDHGPDEIAGHDPVFGPVSAALAVLMAIFSLLAWADPATADDLAASDAAAGHQGQVTIIVLPPGTSPADLGGLEHAAIGLMNPGLGDVSAQQTWLDVSQGARAFDSAYNTPLDRVYPGGEFAQGWEKVIRRAKSSEATVIPGLLASVLASRDIDAVAVDSAGAAALTVARRDGGVARAPQACGGPESMLDSDSPGVDAAIPGCPDPVTVLSMPLDSAFDASENRKRGDLQIFIEQPPAGSGDQLSIAIAGPGMGGELQSPSTRTDGYVLSTDIAPTILAHFGIDVPKAMTGQPIGSGGKLDVEKLTDLENRYEQVGKRRGAALAIPLLLWIVLAGLVSFASRGLYARPALRLLCLSTILLPAVLLLTAALEPSLAVERAIATLLPVLVAAILMRIAPGWLSLALACGLTVIPYGIDMLAGSALTPRAVIGPNPGLGARFYGIGNELESTLMVLTSIGTGAALTWSGTGGRRAAGWFLALGAAATVVFAAGRFGADVGAAIVFPVSAVVAAAFAAGRPRLAWIGLAAAVAALLLIALADTVTGSETHFVRSIFGGTGGSVFETVGHRLDATLESFTKVSRIPVTLIALALIAAAVWKRRIVLGWFAGSPMMIPAIAAAAAGSLVGALTNDSGALFIQVGTLYLALVAGFAWTTSK
ncbi:MAG: hypothetical protein KDB66_08510 [Solirubrobacterales bacterium]|nr:hypothetical protein [Solirubrobacterales bacterium]